jgi:cytochrome c oxidase assembly factor CtaG
VTLRARLSAATLVAVAVVGALVARGITDHDGPVLPLALCRAGQRIAYLPPLTGHTAFTAWQGDVLFDIAIGLAVIAYAVGAHRYRAATGRRWPVGRSLAFAAGLALLVVTLNSALAVYDMTLFSAHMLEHLLLLMVVPAFLVLGRPLTMLLETHPSGSLRRLVDRPAMSYLFAAPTAFGTYVVVIVGTHLTGFMGYVMAHPWAGQVEHVLYLVAGVQFFTAAVGNAPVRWRLSFPGRLLMVMLAMAVDAFVGIVLMQSVVPIATLAHPGWGPTMINDTHLGGALMWVVGDGLMALVPVALYIGWARHSEAKPETPGWYERARVGMFVANGAPDEGAQTDVDVDSDEEQHLAYNRWLASLNARR